MVFPQTQLPVKVEFDLNGWTDVTSYVREGPGITISRGRQDESSQVERTQATFTLDNADGRFSERNPTGPYFGLLSLNTPCRISITRDIKVLDLPGGLVDYVSTPDAAVLDITGDIDIRVDAYLHDWRTNCVLAAKWRVSSQRSWALYIDDGFLKLAWTTGGTTATRTTISATTTTPASAGRLAVRVTLDVNNGASGNTATFYTSDTISGTWTQLGDAVVTSGTTSIHSGTAALETGGWGEADDAGVDLDGSVYGWMYAFQLRSGISGTLVANPDFTAQSVGATSFADTTSSPRTWTLTAGSSLTDRWWRFHGEVSSWPQNWDVAVRDMTVGVVATGPLRRLSQAGSAIRSVLYREAAKSGSTVVAYWPLEDSANSTVAASGIPGGTPMTVAVATPSWGSYDGFSASAPLPTLNGARLAAPVPAYSSSETALMFLVSLPEGGLGADCELLRATVDLSAIGTFVVAYSTASSGSITWTIYNASGALFAGPTTLASSLDGFDLWVILFMLDGSPVDTSISLIKTGETTIAGGTSFSPASTFGQFRHLVINNTAAAVNPAIGHLMVATDVSATFDFFPKLVAYAGEAAGTRFERLCAEENIPFRAIGDIALTQPMGPQRPANLVELLRECAAADGGMLFEPLDALGLGYRTRRSLENQTPVITVDYTAQELASPPIPTGDDEGVRNDVTVTRTGGSSARIELTSGRMSAAAPPSGVGRYASSETVNVQSDSQLPDQANLRVHLGTIDEERYPQIHLSRTTPGVVANADLNLELLSVNVGGVLAIDNLPEPYVAPGQVRQLVQGWSETLGAFVHSFMFNTTPASAWDFGLFGDEVLGRLDTAGSQLASGITSTAVTMSVSTTSGPIWTSSAEEFPFDVTIGGEVITVDFVGQVLNANPSFETNTTGWAAVSATLTRSSTVAKTGSWSGLLTSTAGASPRVEASLVAATAGTVYRAVGWLYAPSALGVDCGVNVNYFDSGSGYLTTHLNQRAITAGEWSLFDTTFTAPANTAFASIVFALSGTPGAGLLLYGDAIRLAPLTSYNASPQTFTATRSVNGVVKSHSSGADVRLTHPLIFSMGD